MQGRGSDLIISTFFFHKLLLLLFATEISQEAMGKVTCLIRVSSVGIFLCPCVPSKKKKK